MSDDNGSPVGEALAVAELPADAPESFSSVSEAAAYLAGQRNKKPAESAEEATAEPESDAQASDAAPEEVPGEDTTEADPAAEPPIERPRSWTKDEDAEWQSLPRSMQQKIVAREQERDTGTRRSQNEAAEERKAAKAERENAEKVRQQYEAQLPALMQELQNAQQSSFADIRTVDDVTRLAAEDPFRYLQWQAHQTKVQAANAELERAKGEQSKAEQTQWAQHVQKENELATEYIPELADKTKGPELTKRAAERLSELGFKSEELNDLASGKQKLSIYDHRIQRLIFSDLKLADIQKAKIAAVAKPVPRVQQPGTSKPPGSAQSETIQALTAKLDRTGDPRDAAALLMAQRARRA